MYSVHVTRQGEILCVKKFANPTHPTSFNILSGANVLPSWHIVAPPMRLISPDVLSQIVRRTGYEIRTDQRNSKQLVVNCLFHSYSFSSHSQSYAVYHCLSWGGSYRRARSCKMCQESIWEFTKEISWMGGPRNFFCKFLRSSVKFLYFTLLFSLLC